MTECLFARICAKISFFSYEKVIANDKQQKHELQQKGLHNFLLLHITTLQHFLRSIEKMTTRNIGFIHLFKMSFVFPMSASFNIHSQFDSTSPCSIIQFTELIREGMLNLIEVITCTHIVFFGVKFFIAE